MAQHRPLRSAGVTALLPVAALVTALVGLASSCTDTHGQPSPFAAGASGTLAPDHVQVGVRDNRYEAPEVHVRVGGTVRWENLGTNQHDVRLAAGSPDAPGFGIDSHDFHPKDTYEHRFTEPGTYAYFCTLHGDAGMRGTVTVGEEAHAPTADEHAAGTIAEPPPVPAGPADADGTLHVPDEYPTIQGAVDAARPGQIVLIGRGEHHEAVNVRTDGIVLRGVDRNETILDGRGEQDNGIEVVGADGVAVENLTVRHYRANGVYWTGATGYRASYATADANGAYGFYAFGSEHGRFEHLLAVAHRDSGFYVGRCDPCDATLEDVTAEYNNFGYSGTNASDVTITGSTFRHNRAGIVLPTLSGIEHTPHHDTRVVGNVVDGSDAQHAVTPAWREWSILYGIGIVAIGAQHDTIDGNVVVDQPRVGIAVAPNPGIQSDVVAATGNRVTANSVRGSGLVDLALVPLPDVGGNCFAANAAATTAPSALVELAPCDGTGSGDPAAGGVDLEAFLDASGAPQGRAPDEVPAPGPQPSMPASGR